MTHPCLNCPLPDCDENSPRCALRQARRLFDRMSRKGWAHLLTDAEREAYNCWFQMWKINHDAEARENSL